MTKDAEEETTTVKGPSSVLGGETTTAKGPPPVLGGVVIRNNPWRKSEELRVMREDEARASRRA